MNEIELINQQLEDLEKQIQLKRQEMIKAKQEANDNEYVEKANVKGQEVLGYVNGFMSYSTSYNISVPKLVSKAMAQEAYNQGYEVDFAFTNQARSAIEQGNLTYANLYKSLL